MHGLSAKQQPVEVLRKPHTPREDGSAACPSILVVDDDEGTLEFLRQYLGRHGFRVAAVAAAEEALEYLEEHAVDLLVLDIFLADADGLVLLAKIRGIYSTLPIIMLTGMGYDEELVEEAQQKGADGYVSKRLVPDQLLLEIHRVMKFGRRHLPLVEAGH